MVHVLLVHPKSSTLNSLPPSRVSCWWQGSDTSYALLIIHTLLFITSYFSLLTCFKCFLSKLSQTHQSFSNIQRFSTVTYFKNFVIHHRSEISNSLSAFHASVQGLASSASSQNTPSRLSPSIVSVLWHASRASSSYPGKTHAVTYHQLVFQFHDMLPGFFHPY